MTSSYTAQCQRGEQDSDKPVVTAVESGFVAFCGEIRVGNIGETRHQDKKEIVWKAARRHLRATETTGIEGVIERREDTSRTLGGVSSPVFLVCGKLAHGLSTIFSGPLLSGDSIFVKKKKKSRLLKPYFFVLSSIDRYNEEMLSCLAIFSSKNFQESKEGFPVMPFRQTKPMGDCSQ